MRNIYKEFDDALRDAERRLDASTIYKTRYKDNAVLYTIGLTSNEIRDHYMMTEQRPGAYTAVVWRSNGQHVTQPPKPYRRFSMGYTLTPHIRHALKILERMPEIRKAEFCRNSPNESADYHWRGVEFSKSLFGSTQFRVFWIMGDANALYFAQILQQCAIARSLVVEAASAVDIWKPQP